MSQSAVSPELANSQNRRGADVPIRWGGLLSRLYPERPLAHAKLPGIQVCAPQAVHTPSAIASAREDDESV
jgi:hypothetical protein